MGVPVDKTRFSEILDPELITRWHEAGAEWVTVRRGAAVSRASWESDRCIVGGVDGVALVLPSKVWIPKALVDSYLYVTATRLLTPVGRAPVVEQEALLRREEDKIARGLVMDAETRQAVISTVLMFRGALLTRAEVTALLTEFGEGLIETAGGRL